MRPLSPASNNGATTDPATAQRPFLPHTTDRVLSVYLGVVLVTTTVILSRYWDHMYEQPLKTWLLVNACLITVRTGGRIAGRCCPVDRWYVFRKCVVWGLRIMTGASFAWFVVGIHLLGKEKEKRGAIVKLMTVLIAFEMGVLGASLVLGVIIFLFALHPLLRGNSGGRAGIKEEDLRKLTSFKFGEEVIEGGNETETACSICLSDYLEGEVLRVLPCKVGRHVFHKECVDEWLVQKLSCPICRDDPLGKGEEEEVDDGEEVV